MGTLALLAPFGSIKGRQCDLAARINMDAPGYPGIWGKWPGERLDFFDFISYEIWVSIFGSWGLYFMYLCNTRSLGALRAPTSSVRPFGPP